MKVLTGLLLLTLVAVCFVAVFNLDVWHEWVVLIMICVTGVGGVIAVSPSRLA